MALWMPLSVFAATILGGIVAGLAFDKAIIQFPAWRQVGSSVWLEYSREGELGRGLIVYPALGVAALLLSVASAIGIALKRNIPLSTSLPFFAAALLAASAFLVTRFGMADQMLRLRQVGNDPDLVQQAFDHLQKWWILKAILACTDFWC